MAFARDGTVESIKDKTQENRFSTHHRAAMSFSRESYVKFHNLGDPHVGMSMERYIAAQGRAFAIVQSDAAYYDFGTFAEVQAFMSRALL